MVGNLVIVLFFLFSALFLLSFSFLIFLVLVSSSFAEARQGKIMAMPSFGCFFHFIGGRRREIICTPAQAVVTVTTYKPAIWRRLLESWGKRTWTLTARYPVRSMIGVFVFCIHCPHNRESSAKETQRELVLHGKNVFIPSPMSCALQPDALQHPASFSRHCLLLCFSIPGRCSCFCHPYYNRVCYVKAARLGLLVPIPDKTLQRTNSVVECGSWKRVCLEVTFYCFWYAVMNYKSTIRLLMRKVRIDEMHPICMTYIYPHS